SSQKKWSVAPLSAASTTRLVSFGIVLARSPPASRIRSPPPLEALWKQEGEYRRAILRSPRWSRSCRQSTKSLKMRRKRNCCEVERSLLAPTHNLKATGSTLDPDLVPRI